MLLKLQKSIEDGDHYEAHQMIRTLYSRWDISGHCNMYRSRLIWVNLNSIYNLYSRSITHFCLCLANVRLQRKNCLQ